MARRKVAPENRIRAAQACENCKRRKQKCNGTFPCNNCSKRLVQCLFFHPVPATGTSPVESTAPPEQRRNSKKRSFEQSPTVSAASKRLAQTPSDSARHDQNNLSFGTRERSYQSPAPRSQHPRDPFPVMSTANGGFPHVENGGGPEEADEAELQGMSRMLNDGKGRMLYIGDSAPLSYLQTIRQLVSSVMGTSALTVDPNRHTILEASVQTPPTYPHTYTLPDREAGLFLVESFFINTKGMLHLFDERSFKQRVERTYHNPLAAEQSWMCILYLVFAVGLQLRSASPQPTPKDAAILKRLLSDKFDRSELFYLGARHLKDSASGIEDGDFASIQALLLMTLYMLSVGKRNTAWAYIGMAVRLSYALGLHRVETQRVYDESERTSISVPRILLWRSLYVMDRFLSSCLGRPTAIQDEEISEELFPSNEDLRTAPGAIDHFEFEALSASMRAARILGTILHQIYRSRKVSLRIARNVAVSIHEWTQSLPEILQWRPTPIPHDDPGKAMGQLHIWMTYFSTIILLTRPFLLLHVKKVITEQQKSKAQASPEAVTNSSAESRVAENPELNKYSAACVRSATHLIRAVQTIRVKGCLPRRNPFIINWMFIAALIVLTNSLFNVYENHENDSIAQIAVLLHQHFGECDPLAARYLQILNSFLKTISDNRSANMATAKEYEQHQDPIENLFKPSMQVPEMAQDVATNYAAMPQMPTMWNWDPNKLPSGDNMLPDITASGLASINDLGGDSVEGLVYPGSEELLGPDLGPIMEEVIHFDTLWPLDEDTGLYHGNIPMYGTSSFL